MRRTDIAEKLPADYRDEIDGDKMYGDFAAPRVY